MEHIDLLVVGGGAAGFFGAIAAAEKKPGLRVWIVEKASQVLGKVRISGGGRCNVTHACFEPRPLSTRYPRGARALLSAFSRFQPSDTIAWFEKKGVLLKKEADGRMFPITDSSETIVDCLCVSAERAGIKVRPRCSLEALNALSQGEWSVLLSDGTRLVARHVLVATGGCRTGNLPEILRNLGHRIEPPVPSLFTFHVPKPWIHELAGLAVPDAHVSVPGTSLKETGPLLMTHWGLSGPAILRLSAWGARELEASRYQFTVRIQWVSGRTPEVWAGELQKTRSAFPGRQVVNTPQANLPARLWEALVRQSGIAEAERWNQLPRPQMMALADLLGRTELPVSGKTLHKDEFVTCGGVSLREVDFKTMQSRICPGLFFAGEVLDVDGITGGFNFQAAWTTGWIAAQAITGN
jgi:predicted Rossmann fold flavoprotein